MNPINSSDPSNSSNPLLAWYVVQTRPRKEEVAKSYLSKKGLEIFSPLTDDFVLRNGIVNKKFRPLFPSYIFGKFELEKDYPVVRWGRGVKKVLGLGGDYPTPVSEEVIEIIKRRTDSYGVVIKSYRFETNDRVRIKSGPLKDLLGIFERWVSDDDRVRILLNLVGYQPYIELHHSMIEKIA